MTNSANIDTPYGDRRCMVEDPWGNTGQIAMQKRSSDVQRTLFVKSCRIKTRDDGLR